MPTIAEKKAALKQKIQNTLKSVEERLDRRDKIAEEFALTFQHWKNGLTLQEMQNRLQRLATNERHLKEALSEVDEFTLYCESHVNDLLAEYQMPVLVVETDVKELDRFSTIMTTEEMKSSTVSTAYKVKQLIELVREKKANLLKDEVFTEKQKQKEREILETKVGYIIEMWYRIPADYKSPKTKSDKDDILSICVEIVSSGEQKKEVSKKTKEILEEVFADLSAKEADKVSEVNCAQ